MNVDCDRCANLASANCLDCAIGEAAAGRTPAADTRVRFQPLHEEPEPE